MSRVFEVTCALIIDRDRVLAVQRSERMAHPLKWEFPGGKVKTGESHLDCIRREICEELGIEVVVRQKLPFLHHTYPTQRITLIPFICTAGEGSITLTEHKALSWVPPEALEELDWLEGDLELIRILIRMFREGNLPGLDKNDGRSS